MIINLPENTQFSGKYSILLPINTVAQNIIIQALKDKTRSLFGR